MTGTVWYGTFSLRNALAAKTETKKRIEYFPFAMTLQANLDLYLILIVAK